MHFQRAFTLVELLVVITLIAILASITGWALQGIMDRSADAQDLSNLRQIGTAISSYAAENNGTIPTAATQIPGTKTSPSNPDRVSFFESIDRMMPPDKQFSPTSIYNCGRRPVWFSKRFAQVPPGKTFDKNITFNWGSAWGINNNLYSYNYATFSGYLNRIPDRSKLVLIGEKNDVQLSYDPSKSPTFEKNVEARYRVSRGTGGTNNKAYYLFADFHIESIAGDQSTIAHPEYLKYDPTNRLYYKWW